MKVSLTYFVIRFKGIQYDDHVVRERILGRSVMEGAKSQKGSYTSAQDPKYRSLLALHTIIALRYCSVTCFSYLHPPHIPTHLTPYFGNSTAIQLKEYDVVRSQYHGRAS